MSARDTHARFSVEHHGGQHKDRSVNKEGDRQGHRRINGVKADSTADRVFITLQLSRLDESRVQIQVVWHDRGTNNPDCHDKHPALAKVGTQQNLAHFQETGLGLRQHKNLDSITDADGSDEYRNHGLEHPHAQPLQGQQEQHIKSGDDDRPRHGNVEQQIKGDRAPQRLCEIGRGNRELH